MADTVVANLDTFFTTPVSFTSLEAVILTFTFMPGLMLNISCSPTRAINSNLLKSTILPMY
ncbi:hypothetical protein D3C81_2200830 [compost metagenome]